MNKDNDMIVSNIPVGVEPTEPDQQTGVDNGNKDQFVSKNDFDARIAEVEENNRRNAQSYSMQAENRIGKVIKEGLSDLQRTISMQKEMGVEIPADKISAMKTKIITDAYEKEDDSSGSPAQPKQSQPMGTTPANAYDQNPPKQDPEVERTLAEARGMAEMAGYTIEPNDPELAGLRPFLTQETPPAKFKEAFGKALKEKGARLQTLGIAQNPNAISRGAVNNPDLMKEYNDKKKLVPRGSIKEYEALRREYAEKGLPI